MQNKTNWENGRVQSNRIAYVKRVFIEREFTCPHKYLQLRHVLNLKFRSPLVLKLDVNGGESAIKGTVKLTVQLWFSFESSA